MEEFEEYRSDENEEKAAHYSFDDDDAELPKPKKRRRSSSRNSYAKKGAVMHNDRAMLDNLRKSLGLSKNYYQILVDGMIAVPRTKDINKFETYKALYEEGVSKEVTVEIFNTDNPNNNRPTRHVIDMLTSSPAKRNSQMDLAGLVQGELAKAKLEWRMEKLEEENAELKEELDEAKEYYKNKIAKIQKEHEEEEKDWMDIAEKQHQKLEVLTGKLEDAELQRQKFLGMGEITAGLVSAGSEFIKRNPTHPITKSLEGLPIKYMFTEYPEKIDTPEEDGINIDGAQEDEPHIERRATPTGFDQQVIRFWRTMKERFPEEQFAQIPPLIEKMSEDNGFATKVLSMTNEDLNL